ncbi:caspase-2 isoform X1 [Osmerus eperlanus]|uniref:caspase-2 isoform X1 n=1 Tax=Osmerus eperlanus TaxID=29151 RepID=UPI002E0D6282
MLGGMQERDKKALRKRSVILSKEMVVDELLVQSLTADEILTDSMAESILVEKTSQKRSYRLLSLLPKRGPRAFSSFCSALKDTEQHHLSALLTEYSESDSREADTKGPQAETEIETVTSSETQQESECCLVTRTPERPRDTERDVDSEREVQSSQTLERHREEDCEVGSVGTTPGQAFCCCSPECPERETLTDSEERETLTDSEERETLTDSEERETLTDSEERETLTDNEERETLTDNEERETITDSEERGRTGQGRKRGRREERERLLDSPFPLSTQEGVFTAKRPRTHESVEMCLDADSPITTPVLPCTPDFYLSHYPQSYPMVSSRRGLALVISNTVFEATAPDLETRKGGEVDEEVLRKVFTELEYQVTVQRDLTAQDMRMCIEAFRRQQDHGNMDSSVLCLLSHGVEGAVYGTDGELLPLDWVFEAFDNAHCPLLQNKPKMFFIQACRGEEMDCGVEQLDGPGRTSSPGCEERDAGREGEGDGDGRRRQERGRLRVKLPQRSDMICGYASLKGTAAMRNTKRGSWFIQELNTALRLRARDTHLSDIMVQVNGRIKEREGYAPGTPHHRCKEMSEFTSSLCKDLYLFPKYHPHY